MNISLVPLAEVHFSLLLRWLLTPHVRQWWDSGMVWTQERIIEKYRDYTEGYKFENGLRKPIEAFIITVDAVPVGYIQAYNPYDFRREQLLENVPVSLLALDLYIGESDFLNKGVGCQAIMLLLSRYVGKYEYAFVDPAINNSVAIRMYEKGGFTKCAYTPDGVCWMVKHLN